MAHPGRNPHVVSHTERLAFQLRDDRKIKRLHVFRSTRSSNLQVNQRRLIYQFAGREPSVPQRITQRQYVGEIPTFEISEE
jgi:hypothetical protein